MAMTRARDARVRVEFKVLQLFRFEQLCRLINLKEWRRVEIRRAQAL